jgi:hypothetical protein
VCCDPCALRVAQHERLAECDAVRGGPARVHFDQETRWQRGERSVHAPLQAACVRCESEAVAGFVERGEARDGEADEIEMIDGVAGGDEVADERVGVSERDGKQCAERVVIADRMQCRIGCLDVRHGCLLLHVGDASRARAGYPAFDEHLFCRDVRAAKEQWRTGIRIGAGCTGCGIDFATAEGVHHGGASGENAPFDRPAQCDGDLLREVGGYASDGFVGIAHFERRNQSGHCTDDELAAFGRRRGVRQSREQKA